MKRAALGLTIATLLATPSNAALSPSSCFTDREFEDVLLIVAPAALKTMSAQCAAVLPKGEVLGNVDSLLSRNLDAVSDEAWPNARAAFLRVIASRGSPAPKGFAMTKEMFVGLITQRFGKIIKNPESCAPADRMLKLAEPLPPRNFAGIMMQIVRIMPNRKDKDFLCSAAQ